MSATQLSGHSKEYLIVPAVERNIHVHCRFLQVLPQISINSFPSESKSVFMSI